MIDLKKFDEKFTQIETEIQEIVNNLDIDSIDPCKFKLSEYEKSELTSLKKKHQGIYIFYLCKKKLSDFEKKWNASKIEKHSPKIIKDRIKEHTNTNKEWIPLYIGKSEKIKNRIEEHITKKKESTTSSMKLRERKMFDNDIFAVRVISLETEKYGIIAHYVESVLRKKIKPIVGKE